MLSIVRRLLFGTRLPTAHAKHERLPKYLALPVFASDAVSSVAYATEEILITLGVLGAMAWTFSLPIAAAIVALLIIVVTSYRLTILSYPQGGGSYIVSKENLGVKFGLVAAAALLTGYVVTVSVSMSAGVSAIISAYPHLEPWRVEMGILFVSIVALGNLRGVRESGTVFSVPTYLFVVCLLITILTGLFKWATGAEINHVVPPDKELPVTGSLTALLLLTAFSRGCSAMTGTEAIADGVQAFKPPEARNAAATLLMMAAILVTLFSGITVLASVYRVFPAGGDHGAGPETVVSQLVRAIFGTGPFYFLVQYATAAILILAANTAYQDFPRLSSILARDRFAPRQLANVGDRLVYTNGILALSALSVLLIVYFRGDVNKMIPLYAVGVFLAFTLSQAGMSRRLHKLRPPGWRILGKVSAFGATVTALVTVISATVNFLAGAWIVLVIISFLVYVFTKINQHYMELARQLRVTRPGEVRPVKSTAIVLTAGIHKGVLQALEYARTLSHDCRALYIEIDPNETPLMRDRWERFGMGIPLVILESPYRSVVEPVLDYLEEAKKERPDYTITVVLPEFVPAKWWHKALHNQSGFWLKVALLFRRDIVVTNVRYYLDT